VSTTPAERLERTPSPADVLIVRPSLTPTLSDLAFLLPIVVLFWCTTGVGWLLTDSDMGWHIRTGAWILNNGRIPAVDIFSFTKNGQPWIAWEWLSDVAMALTHLAGGLPAVILLALLLLGATAVCVYRSTVAASGHRFIALVLTGLAMAASTVHWLARPHLATPLMAAIFCLVLNRTENDGKPRHLWILPPLSAIWANLHGGFFVGIVLLITYALGAFAEEFLLGVTKNAFRHARNYIWIAIGCAVASLINPYGYHLHVHIAQYLGSSFYFERISEFQSVDFHSFAAAYFETLLVLAIAASAWHLSSGKLTQALLLLSWTHLALFSARNIPIFAAVVSPAIGLATREWLECVASRSPASWLGKFSTSIAELEAGLSTIAQNRPKRQLHVLPCLAVALLALVLFHPGKVRTFRAEFDRDRFPVDAAAFLSQQTNNSEMRIYASWQWGGYLIYRLWPSLTVFDDGRTDFYGPGFVDQGLRVWNVSPDWRKILERSGVNSVLVPVDSSLAGALRETHEWKLVYHDSVAVLFDKRENSGTSGRF
jgi:hypothetical protein